MRLKVLGAYGATDASHNLTGYLIDDRVAVDSGTLTSKLTLAQQARIEAVFVTHAHADHTRDLPHLILNRFHLNVPPLQVIASAIVMEELRRYLFNGLVWPDFEGIISPDTGMPAVQYRSVVPGKRISYNNIGFTPVNVEHSVPAAGVIIDIDGQGIVFTGDTGPTKEIWKRTNKADGIVGIVTEASFPNDYHQLAIDSGHLTPDTFRVELAKIEKDVPVYASHRKIPYDKKIESEIRNIRDRRARVLVEKQYTL